MNKITVEDYTHDLYGLLSRHNRRSSMTTEEMIKVLEAYREGEKIQFREIPRGPWINCDLPGWDFVDYEYRIKPAERKPREWWINFGGIFKSKKEAERFYIPGEAIHVREILE